MTKTISMLNLMSPNLMTKTTSMLKHHNTNLMTKLMMMTNSNQIYNKPIIID